MWDAYDQDDASPYFEKNERPVMGGAPTARAAPQLAAGEPPTTSHAARSATRPAWHRARPPNIAIKCRGYHAPRQRYGSALPPTWSARRSYSTTTPADVVHRPMPALLNARMRT
jgi:hypothetical protein